MAMVMQKWLKQNTFKVHLLAFLLMTVPAALLFQAGTSGSLGWIWFLLGLVISGNILVLLVR